MKFRGSHKFVIGVVAIVLAVWGGWQAYAWYRLKGVVIDTIEPGQVNIVAISPAAGYKIIVANQIAYLGKVEGDFGEEEIEATAEDVSNKSRLPLRELLQTLQGDEEALGVLIMRLNDWPDTDIAQGTKVWKAEDIQRALDGDEALAKELTEDLNVDLNGVPLGQVSMKAIQEGIIIDSPVPMQIKVGGQTKTMVGRVQELYQPRFSFSVLQRIRERPPGGELSSYLQGVYRELAEPIVAEGKGEDVAGSLRTRIGKRRMSDLTVTPRQVLDNTVILLNESHVTRADYESYEVGQGETACDVSIGLTEAGRMRLWKYSHENRGFQLLFIVDTVAIAAPRITTELAESTVTIRRVPSKDLVADAVALLNEIITENT